jgi:hypothetical protein
MPHLSTLKFFIHMSGLLLLFPSIITQLKHVILGNVWEEYLFISKRIIAVALITRHKHRKRLY